MQTQLTPFYLKPIFDKSIVNSILDFADESCNLNLALKAINESFLPNDLIRSVFEWLSVYDLTQMRVVCRGFKHIESNSSWNLFIANARRVHHTFQTLFSTYGEIITFLPSKEDDLCCTKSYTKEEIIFLKTLFDASFEPILDGKEALAAWQRASQSLKGYSDVNIATALMTGDLENCEAGFDILYQGVAKKNINAIELLCKNYEKIGNEKLKECLLVAEDCHIEKSEMFIFFAWLYRNVIGIGDHDPNLDPDVKAFEWYKKGADLRHADCLLHTGISFVKGMGTPKDVNLGKEYIQLALEQGSTKAHTFLGDNHYTSEEERDYERALNHFEQSDTFLVSQYRLCQFYSKGLGCQKDHEKAKYYFEMLKNQTQKFTDYYYFLAMCYLEGMGTAQNLVLAEENFINSNSNQITSNGNGRSYMQLGILSEGRGDIEAACYAYLSAASRDMAFAQYSICRLFKLYPNFGEGYTKHCFNCLLEEHEVTDPHLLGRRYSYISKCYENGWGTDCDPEKAGEYFQLSADNGYAGAQFEICKKIGTPHAEVAKHYFALLSDPNHREGPEDIHNRYTMIAECYKMGYGVIVDEEKASYYAELANF